MEKGEQVPTSSLIVNKVLFYKERYVLAKSSPFIHVLLREYHDSPLGGHVWRVNGIGRVCGGKSHDMFGNAKYVNKLRLQI